MAKVPFVTKEQLDEIVKKYPTPFHLYDEKGIRETARGCSLLTIHQQKNLFWQNS